MPVAGLSGATASYRLPFDYRIANVREFARLRRKLRRIRSDQGREALGLGVPNSFECKEREDADGD